jgi:hypothetical protein
MFQRLLFRLWKIYYIKGSSLPYMKSTEDECNYAICTPGSFI